MYSVCKLFGRTSDAADVLIILAGLTPNAEICIWAAMESVECGDVLRVRDCMDELRKMYTSELYGSHEKVREFLFSKRYIDVFGVLVY
jgi:hypothetical protein